MTGRGLATLDAALVNGSHARAAERRTLRPPTSESDRAKSVQSDTSSVVFEDVEVVRRANGMLMVRVGTRLVAVSLHRVLAGTTVDQTGHRGRLVLPREVALNIGLV